MRCLTQSLEHCAAVPTAVRYTTAVQLGACFAPQEFDLWHKRNWKVLLAILQVLAGSYWNGPSRSWRSWLNIRFSVFLNANSGESPTLGSKLPKHDCSAYTSPSQLPILSSDLVILLFPNHNSFLWWPVHSAQRQTALKDMLTALKGWATNEWTEPCSRPQAADIFNKCDFVRSRSIRPDSFITRNANTCIRPNTSTPHASIDPNRFRLSSEQHITQYTTEVGGGRACK